MGKIKQQRVKKIKRNNIKTNFGYIRTITMTQHRVVLGPNLDHSIGERKKKQKNKITVTKQAHSNLLKRK